MPQSAVFCQIKYWAIAGLVVFMTMSVVASDVSQPVGVLRVDVGADSSLLMSLPFDSFDTSLVGVFGDQLDAAAAAADADQVTVWSSGQSVTSYRQPDGLYYFDTGGASTTTLAPGTGFWLHNDGSAQTYVVAGKVPLDASRTVTFSSGLNLFGHAFPETIDINSSSLSLEASGATLIDNADQVIEADNTKTWLFDDGVPANREWLDESNVLATSSLAIGVGYSYDRSIATTMNWLSVPSYDTAAFSITATPKISGVDVDHGASSITLTIDSTGVAGESLEIFAQDIANAGSFTSVGGWSVAAQGLLTNGATSYTWADSSFFADTNSGTTVARVYVVVDGQDDTDNDGLSDAQEDLVWQSDPNLSDSDGDGLPDGWEVAHGLDPLVDDSGLDTDGDGYANADEYAMGTEPNTAPEAPLMTANLPKRFLSTNKDSAHLFVRFVGGGMHPATVAAIQQTDPNFLPTQRGVVTSIDVLIDDVVVASWTNVDAKNEGTAIITCDLSGLTEGAHTIAAKAHWLGSDDPSVPAELGESNEVNFTVDRTPPTALDVAAATVTGGTLAAGTVTTTEREISITCPVASDVVWVVFEDSPSESCFIHRSSWTIDNGNLNLTVCGIKMGTSQLDIKVMDSACNISTSTLALDRQEGGAQ